MSDGVGQARLDLGLSFGFLRAGPTRGRWMWGERWDHRQHDHVSREALHLARLLRSLPRVDSLVLHFNGGPVPLFPPAPRLLGHGQGTAAKEARSREGTAPEEVPAARARWREERCQGG